MKYDLLGVTVLVAAFSADRYQFGPILSCPYPVQTIHDNSFCGL